MSPAMSGLSATNPSLLSRSLILSGTPSPRTTPSSPLASSPDDSTYMTPSSPPASDLSDSLSLPAVDDHDLRSESPVSFYSVEHIDNHTGPPPPITGHISPPRKLSKPHLASLITATHISSPYAVLLPEHCWKPDANATVCDSFTCETRFGLLARRHHCRKCGGVFCASCSSHRVPLLDTSDLPFIFPPADSQYVSSPMSPSSSTASVPSLSSSISSVPSTSSADSISSASSATQVSPAPISIHRVCDPCYTELRTGRSPRVSISSSKGPLSPLDQSPAHPTPLSRASSLRHQVGGRSLRHFASVSSLQHDLESPDVKGPVVRPGFRRSHSSSSSPGGLPASGATTPSSGTPRRFSRLSAADAGIVPCTPPTSSPLSPISPPGVNQLTANTLSGVEMLHNALHTPPDRSRAIAQSVASNSSARSRARARENAEKERALTGEIQAYPLKVSAAACHARGGGVWTPNPLPASVQVRNLFQAPSERKRLDDILRKGRVYMDGKSGCESCYGQVKLYGAAGASSDDEDDDDALEDDEKADKLRQWRGRLIKDGDIQVRVPVVPNPAIRFARRHTLRWTTF